MPELINLIADESMTIDHITILPRKLSGTDRKGSTESPLCLHIIP